MGTNEIVSDIIDEFIEELQKDNYKDQTTINSIKILLKGTEKITSIKIEQILTEYKNEL